MIKLFWVSTLLLPLIALPAGLEQCNGGDDDTPDPSGTPGPLEGEDETLVAFDGVHQQFGQGDTRTVSTPMTFPDEVWQYDAITLHYTLSCPDGGCDPWDRLAYVQVVSQEGTDDERVVEVGRFITPYGVGGSWSVDVTDLRPMLAGERVVRSFIDTWVNPGWLVDVSFEFHGGTPARRAIDVQPLWFGYYTYGDPSNPPETYLTPQSASVPVGATGASMRVLATGHGFGATENCAEFCQKEHTLVAGGAENTQVVWRNDCLTAGVPGQSGTFWYSRAGWCPGDDVVPRVWDVTTQAPAGGEATFEYRLQNYLNLETDVQPFWVISAYLVIYE